jgi:hypothetical protein
VFKQAVQAASTSPPPPAPVSSASQYTTTPTQATGTYVAFSPSPNTLTSASVKTPVPASSSLLDQVCGVYSLILIAFRVVQVYLRIVLCVRLGTDSYVLPPIAQAYKEAMSGTSKPTTSNSFTQKPVGDDFFSKWTSASATSTSSTTSTSTPYSSSQPMSTSSSSGFGAQPSTSASVSSASSASTSDRFAGRKAISSDEMFGIQPDP